MAVDKLPDVGEDAFDAGFLNRDRANKALHRINRQFEIKFTNGLTQPKVTESEENILIELPPSGGVAVTVTGSLNGVPAVGTAYFTGQPVVL